MHRNRNPIVTAEKSQPISQKESLRTVWPRKRIADFDRKSSLGDGALSSGPLCVSWQKDMPREDLSCNWSCNLAVKISRRVKILTCSPSADDTNGTHYVAEVPEAGFLQLQEKLFAKMAAPEHWQICSSFPCSLAKEIEDKQPSNSSERSNPPKDRPPKSKLNLALFTQTISELCEQTDPCFPLKTS